MFAMEEIAKHDKTKLNVAPTMRVLSREDPRCHGLAEGFCRMACDTCPFVSRPIEDDYIHKYNMQKRCYTAHRPPSVTADQPVQQTLAIQQARPLHRGSRMESNPFAIDTQPTSFAQFAPLGTVANAPFDAQLSDQIAPMEIVGTSTTTNARVTQSSSNDQGVVRKQITRHMADGTVEHEVSEERKNATNQTQIAEYQQTITHLQSQLRLVDSKWTEAKEECHDLQRNSTALSDVMGTAVCEAVMKKAPGTELTVALLLIPRLLLALDELRKAGMLETFCKALPSATTNDPYIKMVLKERVGADAFNDLVTMTDGDYKKKLPHLAKVGATPDLLRDRKSVV